MKTIVITILTLLSINSLAQKIKIIRTDSTTVDASLIGSSSNSLYTDKGTEEFYNINEVIFVGVFNRNNNSTVDKLLKAGILVTLDGEKQGDPTLRKSIPIKSNNSTSKVFVNGIDVNSLDIEYVEIVANGTFLSMKVVVSLYYGQPLAFGDRQIIKDANGTAPRFNGVIDTLNFMHKNGWEFVNAYTVTTGNQNVYHYILRRI